MLYLMSTLMTKVSCYATLWLSIYLNMVFQMVTGIVATDRLYRLWQRDQHDVRSLQPHKADHTVQSNLRLVSSSPLPQRQLLVISMHYCYLNKMQTSQVSNYVPNGVRCREVYTR